MEIELKFQVPADRREALRRAVATGSAQRTRLQAVYADTADDRLAAAGLALRLRKEGRRWVQTLKGRGDGLMQRLEHEVALPAQRGEPALDPARHDGTPAGALLQPLLADGAALQPLYRTDIQRLHRVVRSGGARIEIAFDEGVITAGNARLPVCEIEFELLSGPPAALVALAQRWVTRHGLWWDVRTKSERGFRLARGLVHKPPERAGASRLSPQASPAQAWSAVLQSTLAQALPNLAELAPEDAPGATPEHLHQLRVALRRMRSMLALLADWSPDAAAAQALQADWRAPFNQLGAARDADVLATGLGPELDAAGAPPAGAGPGGEAPAPGPLLRSPAFSGLLLRTLALALPVPQAADATPLPLRQAAARVLQADWRALRRDVAGIATLDEAGQHRTRRRLKRLRYACEALQPLWPGKPARRWQARLNAAIDALGRSNDLAMAQGVLAAAPEKTPRTWFALGWLAAQRGPALAGAAERLRRLGETPRPWRGK